MKLYKYQSFLESKTDIDSICKKYGIRNYTINEDGTIDVDGNVFLGNKKLTKLPLKFKNVTGYFDCSRNHLTTLEGCPKSVGGDFYCGYNQLTSLEGGPKSVGGDFYCNRNQLTSLKGFPEFWEGKFYYSNNPISYILYQFPEDKVCKAIHWINEYEVIQNGKVIPERMDEVYYELGLDISN